MGITYLLRQPCHRIDSGADANRCRILPLSLSGAIGGVRRTLMSLGLPVASGPYGAIHYQINTRRDAGDAWSATSIAPQGHHHLACPL